MIVSVRVRFLKIVVNDFGGPYGAPTRADEKQGLDWRFCSNYPSSDPQLFTKPGVGGLAAEPGMPGHEIRKIPDLVRRV